VSLLGSVVLNVEKMAESNEWVEIGRSLVEKRINPDTGERFKVRELELNGRRYVFNEKQSEFISDLDTSHKFILFSGGRGCGKSLALVVKMYLICKCFPGIRVLLGRKHISDIEKTTLNDFRKIVPAKEYEYRVKDGLINFSNGSQIVLMGLDSMQSGDVAEMKKAEQKTKSLNIGAYFLDQLEEIEYDVFQKLNDTMRMKAPPGELDYPRQGNMTTNPANFWAYHYFKEDKWMDEDGNWFPKKVKDSVLIEGSMLDNRENLPEDFVQDRMNRDDSYVRRFVYGVWDMSILVRGTVFAKEYIARLKKETRKPIEIKEGCEIYEQPRNLMYQIGVDPSEGIVDPSAVVVSSENGSIVATYTGMSTIPELADKIKFLYYHYNKPLIIPEVNKSSLLEHIKDLKIYRRRHFDYKTKKESERLGFVTSWTTKQALITHFQELLRNNVPRILNLKIINEMESFVWSDEASRMGAGASRGFHDDLIIATMLSYWEFNPKRVEEILVARSQPVRERRFQYK